MDDEDVPLNIRAIDAAQYQFELDAWVRWDMPSEDYYDLWHVPEQFTGYDGSEIWRFIHQKICFPKENYSQKLGTEEGAVWQRDFNRAVSGLHSSISAHIVQGMKSEEGGASGGGGGGAAAANYAAAAASSAAAAARADLSSFPQAEYERRLSRSGENPQALDHLYFAYMLCLCGVREAGERFDFGQDNDSLLGAEGRRLVAQVLRSPLLNDRGILVAQSNLRSHAVETGGNLWQARLRTRDLIKYACPSVFVFAKKKMKQHSSCDNFVAASSFVCFLAPFDTFAVNLSSLTLILCSYFETPDLNFLD